MVLNWLSVALTCLPACRLPALPSAIVSLPAASMATEASRYKDDVMDWLGLQRDSQHRLTMGNDTAAPANVTDATAGAAPAAEAEAPADGVAAGEEAAAAEEAADEAAVGDAEGIEEEAELRVALHSS
jgi:hypothetical protein